METNFQDEGNNGFSCHSYAPNSTSNPTAAFEVSHLFASLNPTIPTTTGGAASPAPK